MATTESSGPQVGDPAPTFTLPTTDGRQVSLDDFTGKQAVVLYFYPKDDTPGCTKEACTFRDMRGEFAAKGAEILGVSPDSVSSHEKFREKFQLPFPLLADEGHAIAEKYGVWQEKTFMGKTSMGIARTTFVIGRDGKVSAVFPNVKVDGHGDEVMQAVEKAK